MADNALENTENQEVENQGDATLDFQGKHENYMPIGRRVPIKTDDEYIKERLDDQIAWYDRKSSLNQRKYKKLKRMEFIIAASIPVVISLSQMRIVEDFHHLNTILQVLATFAGVILVVMNKFFELEGYYKFWKEYRTTCETLQYERIMYLTRTEPYDEDDAFPLLVKNVETILSSEVQKWQSLSRDKKGKEKEAEKI